MEGLPVPSITTLTGTSEVSHAGLCGSNREQKPWSVPRINESWSHVVSLPLYCPIQERGGGEGGMEGGRGRERKASYLSMGDWIYDFFTRTLIENIYLRSSHLHCTTEEYQKAELMLYQPKILSKCCSFKNEAYSIPSLTKKKFFFLKLGISFT